MNHAITLHDVLKIVGYVGGAILAFGGIAISVLYSWANQARTAPRADAGATGPFVVGCIGLAMIIGAFFVP